MEDYLKQLAARGCRFWLQDGSLRMSAPAGLITPELKAELRERKEAITAYLKQVPARSPAATDRLAPRDPAATVPLMGGQQRLLALAGSQKQASAYNVPVAFEITGALDVKALRKALAAIEARHEVLRTVLAPDRQVVQPAGTWDGFALRRIEDDDAVQEERLQREAGLAIDVASGPLWRATVFSRTPERHVLSLVFHHAIFDGFSRNVFLRELSAFYRAEVTGTQAEGVRALAVQVGDVALWQRTARMQEARQRDIAYWTQRFDRPVAGLALPAPVAAPGARSEAVGHGFTLGSAEARLLRQRAAEYGIVPAAILLAACALLMNRHTHQTGLLFSSPLTNRPLPEMEDLIGYFNAVAPLHVTVEEAGHQIEVARAAHRLILDASGHQNADLEDISALPAMARTPLHRAMVSVQEVREAPFGLEELEVTPLTLRKEAADFDLAFNFEVADEAITGVIDFNTALFNAERRGQMIARLEQALTGLLEAPRTTVSDLPAYGAAPATITALLEGDVRVDAAHVEHSGETGTATAWMKLNEDRDATMDDIRAVLAAHLEPWQVPARLIPVDDLPLRADGTVDAASLREAARAREAIAAAGREPQSALEQTIAAVWRKVLWLDHEIGLDDRFHDLGGHSLLAVRMIAALEEALGRRLPPRALRELTTLDAFARAIEEAGEAAPEEDEDGGEIGGIKPSVLHRMQTYTASWQGWRRTPESPVIGKNVEGSRIPLFWCLQNYNELNQLAKYLGPDQPVYGMRSGNHVMVKSQANINRLGVTYAAEIARIVPPGPVLVGGNCQAAQIAFQVACRLRERGYAIPLLFLQEKFIPLPYDGDVALIFGRQSDRNPYLSNQTPEKDFARAYTGRFTVDLVEGSHAQFFREPNVQDLIRVLKLRRDERVQPEG